MGFFRGDIYSYHLSKMTPLHIYLPHDDNHRFLVDKPSRTLILLHGLGGNHTYWSRFTAVERYAQKNNLTVIMPEADMSMYADMSCGHDYASYLSIELKEILGKMFHVSTERERYFIAGLSMGGYGALKLAMKFPDQFGKCASFSGALMIGSREHLKELSEWKDPGRPKVYDEDYELMKELRQGCVGAFGEDLKYRDSEDLFALTRKAGDRKICLPEILMTCGTNDFVFDVNREYCRLLDELKMSYEFHEWKGTHEWGFWDESIRDYIGFFDIDEDSQDSSNKAIRKEVGYGGN
ncbi:putative esterase [Denitrovibrio acetiphilus DSM 12809]|uniref:Putative esterase n=1 Tax=Denitrovibrio acetiphilus (strain DSM 12809 / NBRC 114555 / N2460) TaxID=522772 RepID=D4H260_DENA2|nr:alpha/beta hydrolase family protein [Denitrovibrio acetiphilus]ADD68851.1 putative esterase [Denitrovibrio acetiphilus DSM 12809]